MARLITACLTLTLGQLGVLAASAGTNPAPPSASQTRPIPDAYRLNLLIRTTLIALNQANQTGNYTVLRDLASPSFQRANSAARLAEIFAGLRNRNLDLSPIMFFEPKLIRPPQINEAGMLRLSGFIPSEPEQVLFDLLFESVDNRWQLFGISVDVRPPAAREAPAEKPAEPQPKKGAPVAKKSSDSKNKK